MLIPIILTLCLSQPPTIQPTSRPASRPSNRSQAERKAQIKPVQIYTYSATNAASIIRGKKAKTIIGHRISDVFEITKIKPHNKNDYEVWFTLQDPDKDITTRISISMHMTEDQVLKNELVEEKIVRVIGTIDGFEVNKLKVRNLGFLPAGPSYSVFIYLKPAK